MGAIGVG